MYQVSVLAVILFVNGVQIPLTAPAMVEGDTTWLPLRSVFQELGWKVKWDARGEAPFLAWKAGWEWTAPTVTLSAPGRRDIVLRVGERLAAGESYEVYTRWTVPEGDSRLSSGLYYIKGSVNQDVSAYRRTIAITASD